MFMFHLLLHNLVPGRVYLVDIVMYTIDI